MYEDCKGNFFTNPSYVQLSLKDVIEHFRDSLPLDVVLFVNSDVSSDDITHLHSEVITLTQLAVQSSIVATASVNESDEIPEIDDSTITTNIPTDLKIYVSVLGGQLKDDPVYEDPRHLYDTCNLSEGETSTHSYMTLRQSVTSEELHYKSLGNTVSQLSKQIPPHSANTDGKSPLVMMKYNCNDYIYFYCNHYAG